jgi:hypothetical protein
MEGVMMSVTIVPKSEHAISPDGSGEPTLTTDPITGVTGPLDAVLTTGTILVVDVGGTVSPEGVVVAVAGAGRAGRARTPYSGGDISAVVEVEGESGNAGDDGAGSEEGSEGDHGEYRRLLVSLLACLKVSRAKMKHLYTTLILAGARGFLASA